ncbi:MAG: PIN domain-containing protein [Fibrobacteraceae bacterium]|nr:PIN domain-containing protein [Fibrobacteraceae bacterium]
MKILVDANVLLDYFQHRDGYDNSERILQACENGLISGYVAAHSISNMFFILRKFYSEEERREILRGIISFLPVVEINHYLVESALSRVDFHDFEDCLQDECAIAISADYIVTNNIKDFRQSKTMAILPKDLVQMISV